MRRDRIVRGFIRHRLIVTMRDGHVWDALVMDVDDRMLVLREAFAIQPDRTRLPADGEVLVHRSDVSYMQALAEMQKP